MQDVLSLFGRLAAWVTAALVVIGATGASAQVAGGRDGHYVGVAIGFNTASTQCAPRLSVKGFRVSAGQVQFSGFRGPISPDGSVSIPSKGAWLTGRFQGTEFRGEVDRFNPRTGPGCGYALALKLEGA